MAYQISKGIKVSYDYEELISEIKADIKEGLIDNSSIISVLREPDPNLKGTGYVPIVDYYYPKAFEELNAPLEELYNKDEFTKEEWKKLEEERQQQLNMFLKDEPLLEKATVLSVLTEMEQWNKVI